MRRRSVRWALPKLLAPSSQLLLLLSCRGAPTAPAPPGAGVPLALADARARNISDLRYDLEFRIPEALDQAVTGHATIRLVLADPDQPLVLDFKGKAADVHQVTVGTAVVEPTIADEHVSIPAARLAKGANTVAIDFTAADAALNRRADFMYTLFVPDRARTAFPVFDQPDLKARYRLTLSIPAGWQAVANGSLLSRDSTGPLHVLRFDETAPISTYLFTFAAGKLSVETAERDGRVFHLFHRETDAAKVARNKDAIFDLHAAAIRTLEDYTAIQYPFQKFDFFAVPAFQFGGMEHPGAVWYRAGALFLDQAATRNQLLSRASVIAHETAHMWFGDLVTMRWFDDVWMKEVFANFMAAKIVEPSFPDVNHRLQFYLAHHASAYAVDRTLGANPIRTPLENLNEAGSQYGAIIYEKAPIVMRQLELLIGADTMRAGLREYLDRHRFGNATWPDLITVLDRLSSADLAAWSRAWVEEPGRPTIQATIGTDRRSVTLSEQDPKPGRNLRWIEPLRLTIVAGDSTIHRAVRFTGQDTTVRLSVSPELVLLGTDDVGYGRFGLDSASRRYLVDRLERLSDPLDRAVGWNALFEDVIDGILPPREMMRALLRALPVEPDELIVQAILGRVEGTFWRWSSATARPAEARALESLLWQQLERAPTPGRKVAYFNAIENVTLTPEGRSRLERIWRTRTPPKGLPLSEDQYTTLAETLALRDPPNAESILSEAERRITNPDQLARFRFVRRALSPSEAVRDSVFASFRDPAVRRRESWVLDATSYLHHPLRAAQAEKYLGPSLDLLLEVKRTGDIFFPLAWLGATLDGHNSATAAETVARFIESHPDYPARLKAKLYQAADGLFRSARVVDGWRPGGATGLVLPAFPP